MRFLEIYLKAFGLFSDRAPIELPDIDGPGLCVIYGSNEAGKSTALRAIRALLYGIPARSPDDFIHRYADLRIGARLRFDDGQELAVMRRKKTKDSLYTYDDLDVEPSDRLDRLADAVPESLFERFYGLDHRGLADGSAALLQDDGEVGRALFGAGLGVSNLRGVIESLDREAAELFAPKASKPRINAAVAAWNLERKEMDALSLDPKAWAAQEECVRGAAERLARLDREIEQARRSLSRQQRLKRSLPALARRKAAREALDMATAVAPLSEDFAERLTTARANRRGALASGQRADLKIERLSVARDRLRLAPGLVIERERIDALHQRVGGFQEALDQLPRRESKLAALDQEIESLLLAPRRELSPERLTSLRSAVARAGSTRALANEGLKLEERLAKSREELAEADAGLARLSSQEVGETIPELDGAALRLAIGRAVKLGPIDDRLAEERRAYEALDFEIRRREQALGFAGNQLDEIAAASFPAHEWIDSMREQLADHDRRKESLREQLDTSRADRRRVDEELSKNASQGVVPQLHDLEDRRAEREKHWRTLRRSVIETDSPPDQPSRSQLADRFEHATAETDAVGDRLRVDAKRVAEQVSLEARGQRLDRDLEVLLERGAALADEGRALAAEWVKAWAGTGIEAGTPDAMRGWRRGLDELCALLTQRREAAQSLDRDARGCREAVAGLRGVLTQAEASGGLRCVRLDEWISAGEAMLERLAARDAELRRRAQAVAQAEDRVETARQREQQAVGALSEWLDRWSEAVAFLEAEDRTRPERAVERLDAMSRLLERIRERDELAERVQSMRRDVEAFEHDVLQLVAQCARELADHPPAAATLGLHRMLGEALKQQTLFEKSDEALSEALNEREEAISQATASESAIAGLCVEAAVAEESELDDALRRWREVEANERARRDAEIELTHLAEGRSIAELEGESLDVDSDALSARLASLEEQVRQKTEDQKRAIEELRSQTDLLEAMNGSATVAGLAEAAESKLARIRHDVDRYVQVRMAKQILEAEIERYRSENQAPLLKRSGEIFGALTRGAYPRVSSEAAEDGKGVRLVAVAESGSETPVSGLSSGTRDQLFLAIRLASLEDSRERGESMPLIADDILIEFDDERTRATLEVLAGLARRSQILLFSHHLHVAEIAWDLGGQAHVIEL